MSIIASILNGLLPRPTASSDSPLDFGNSRAWHPVTGAGYFNYYPTPSKELVNENTALLVSAHFACIRCKSEDLSIMPHEVFRIEEDERIAEKGHPVSRLLNREMSPAMSATIGKAVLYAHAIGFRKGVAEILRNGLGEPVALWPLDPTRVYKHTHDETGEIYHAVYTKGGTIRTIPDRNVFEIIGPSYDGQIGYSLAELSQHVIGLALAAQKFQGSFFGQGSWLGGMIEELPKGMSPKQIAELRDSFEQRHRGAGSAFGIGIIPGGAKFKEIGIDPAKAMLIDSLKYTVTDICRFHRVPPHKVQDYGEAHYNNVEQGEIVYRGDALLPLGTAFEHEVQRKLLPDGYIARINYNALQRIDFKTQMDGMAVGRMWGIYTINEVRKKLGEDPIDDEQGDMRLIPANMIPIERAYEDRTKQSTNAADPEKEPVSPAGGLAEAYTPLVIDAVTRCTSKERDRIEKLKGKADSQSRIEIQYRDLRADMTMNVSPIIASMARAAGRLKANEGRLRIVCELFAGEYSDARPAFESDADRAWIAGFSERWVNAALTALELEVEHVAV